MTDTFNVQQPLVGPTGTGTFRLRTAQFGDGYMQVTPDGPNADVQSWPLTWLCTGSEGATLMAFFRAHIGVSFFWTPPLGVQGYYQVMPGYTIVPNGGDKTTNEDTYTVGATFQEMFKP
jgi:phage-related protein